MKSLLGFSKGRVTSVFAIHGSFTFSCQTLESKSTPPIHVILTKQANPSPWLVVMIFLIALQHHSIGFPRWTNYWFIRIPIWPIRKHLIRYSLFSSSMLGPSQAANPPEADFFTDPTGYAQASSSDPLQRPPMQVSWIMHSHLGESAALSLNMVLFKWKRNRTYKMQ